MQDDKIEISVVIPCYNESKRIEQTFIDLMKYFVKHRETFKYELIFVDDGSTDDTYKLLYLFATYYTGWQDKIMIKPMMENKGKGHAVRTGILSANYKNILILDADLSVNLQPLINLSYLYNLNDNARYIIVGERIQIDKQPLYRRFAGWGFRWLVRGMFMLPFRDTQCPFHLLHNYPKEFASELKIDGFAYDVELLYHARKQHINLFRTNVYYNNKEGSKVTLKKAVQMFIDLLKIRFS